LGHTRCGAGSRALDKHGKTHDIKIYEGTEHAFFNDTRPEVHKPDASADAGGA
jgi:carboxymethylenebutenolidase